MLGHPNSCEIIILIIATFAISCAFQCETAILLEKVFFLHRYLNMEKTINKYCNQNTTKQRIHHFHIYATVEGKGRVEAS
jgi:hypothetical protein